MSQTEFESSRRWLRIVAGTEDVVIHVFVGEDGESGDGEVMNVDIGHEVMDERRDEVVNAWPWGDNGVAGV